MGMSDDGLVNRFPWINIKTTGTAIKAFIGEFYQRHAPELRVQSLIVIGISYEAVNLIFIKEANDMPRNPDASWKCVQRCYYGIKQDLKTRSLKNRIECCKGDQFV